MTALAFPWPRGSRAFGAVALQTRWLRGRPKYVGIALARSFDRLATSARRVLARRWPDAEVATVDEAPADGILHEARRRSADVIVLGWRGHGAFRRLLMGSVSRGVVRRAPCAVLVVRRRPREIRRVVIGVDGSPHARRAVQLVTRFEPPRGARVTVVSVVEPMAIPSAGLLPGAVSAPLRREVAALNEEQLRRARRAVESAAGRLRRARWSVRMEVRSGAPLAELLEAVARNAGDLLVVGARATGGVERALLGSVAEGALNRSPVPVLVVR